jgi:hypothetical protein
VRPSSGAAKPCYRRYVKGMRHNELLSRPTCYDGRESMYLIRHRFIWGEDRNMRHMSFAVLVLAGCTTAAMGAQTAGQDMKDAGHATANATKDAGHGIAKGTKTGYDKTKEGTVKATHATVHGTKTGYDKTKEGTVKAAHATAHGTTVAADKTARGTKSLGKKIVGDKSPTTTPHDPPKQ